MEADRSRSVRLVLYALAGAGVLAALYFVRRLVATFRPPTGGPTAARQTGPGAVAAPSDARSGRG